MKREPLVWRLIAKVVSTPPVANWLIRRAMRTPYTHLFVGESQEPYMGRWWLFNPYNRAYLGKWLRLPSIRVHHICQPDSARHPHSHPWKFRTIVLEGWYCEQRYGRPKALAYHRGDTYSMEPGLDFHNIYALPATGVWTLFITWPLRTGKADGTWGFLVDGELVPAQEYKDTIWKRKV